MGMGQGAIKYVLFLNVENMGSYRGLETVIYLEYDGRRGEERGD